jgi:hypothetical protein
MNVKQARTGSSDSARSIASVNVWAGIFFIRDLRLYGPGVLLAVSISGSEICNAKSDLPLVKGDGGNDELGDELKGIEENDAEAEPDPP